MPRADAGHSAPESSFAPALSRICRSCSIRAAALFVAAETLICRSDSPRTAIVTCRTSRGSTSSILLAHSIRQMPPAERISSPPSSRNSSVSRHPVGVDVEQIDLADVLVNERERRAGDRLAVVASCCRNRLHEASFSGSEASVEADDVAWAKDRGESGTEPAGFRFRNRSKVVTGSRGRSFGRHCRDISKRARGISESDRARNRDSHTTSGVRLCEAAVPPHKIVKIVYNRTDRS